jgi:hypothetical protein
MGSPTQALRWVRLMLAGTRAGVLYHGYMSPWFEVLSGAAQGSPLSPVLYILAAQPLAAKLRQLQAAGRIGLPDSEVRASPWACSVCQHLCAGQQGKP